MVGSSLVAKPVPANSSPKKVSGAFSQDAIREISETLNVILADAFALYIKTKNFHWHVSGPHFYDYHTLLDDQAAQILAITDDIAERVRKVGGVTLRSIGHIAQLQQLRDNDAEFVEAQEMLVELCEDNEHLAALMRQAKSVCDEHRDVATSAMLDVWVDEAEKRSWFLRESAKGS